MRVVAASLAKGSKLMVLAALLRRLQREGHPLMCEPSTLSVHCGELVRYVLMVHCLCTETRAGSSVLTSSTEQVRHRRRARAPLSAG